ncbi:hypothetical protein METSCH_E06100 [Metschnikowia aff. pulcherrima]|uniref:Uncharacterized protein n=1 Tax=Metschnikowia aff. pulcherrima TaxID=2163413 RepID=A0A4P6XW87_9ASCO|nr:hypothetical protein METSCH_E06100 [Metschnikowia aff. pulcherrima]
MVGSGLTNSLDQDRQSLGVLTVPWLERSQTLQSVGSWGDDDVHRSSVGRRSLVRVLTLVVTVRWQTDTNWLGQLEFLALRVLQGVSDRVEAQVTRDGVSSDHVWRSDESVGGWVTVVSRSKVSVERRDNSVLVTLLDILSVPLTDTWTTCVGHDNTAKVLESLQLTVSGNGGSHLLGTWRDSEDGLGAQAVLGGVLDDGSRSGHVLVRRVGARTNQTDLDLQRPAVSNSGLLHLGDWGSQVGSEGTVDVRLQGVQVNLNHLVVLAALVGRQVVLLVKLSELGNLRSASGVQVVGH